MPETSLLSRAPWWPVLAVLLIAVGGGIWNTEHAHGRIVADADGSPVQPRDVFYGQRHFAVGDDGVYDIPNLPRGAKVSVVAPGFARTDFDAFETEVRLATAVITYTVLDAVSSQPVPNPEARIGTTVIGRGTTAGSMVVAPAPPKGQDILICAATYESLTVKSGLPSQEVRLQQKGSGCPPLPNASPSPSPSPSAPAPSGTTPPAPSPSGSP